MSPSGNLSQFALPCHPSTTSLQSASPLPGAEHQTGTLPRPGGGEGRPEQHRTASTGLVWLGAQKHLCVSPLCPGFKMRMHCGKPPASFPQRADGSFDFKGHPRTPSYQRPFLVIMQSQVQLPKLPASL